MGFDVSVYFHVFDVRTRADTTDVEANVKIPHGRHVGGCPGSRDATRGTEDLSRGGCARQGTGCPPIQPSVTVGGEPIPNSIYVHIHLDGDTGDGPRPIDRVRPRVGGTRGECENGACRVQRIPGAWVRADRRSGDPRVLWPIEVMTGVTRNVVRDPTDPRDRSDLHRSDDAGGRAVRRQITTCNIITT